MIKSFILLFSVLIIGCCDDSEILKNGLTRPTSKLTEYSITVREDSLKKSILDTLVIVTRKYNDQNFIISRNEQMSFSNEEIDIEYIYNDLKKIKREIVKLSIDSLRFNVNYFYLNSLLYEVKSEFENKAYRIKYIGKYSYNDKSTLASSSISNLNIEANDTIKNTFEISLYDNQGLLIHTKLTDFKNPQKNVFSKYIYSCKILKEVQEFNEKDSLLLKTKYKYEYDKFQNWVKRESFQNGKLVYIQKRKIEYKFQKEI